MLVDMLMLSVLDGVLGLAGGMLSLPRGCVYSLALVFTARTGRLMLVDLTHACGLDACLLTCRAFIFKQPEFLMRELQ